MLSNIWQWTTLQLNNYSPLNYKGQATWKKAMLHLHCPSTRHFKALSHACAAKGPSTKHFLSPSTSHTWLFFTAWLLNRWTLNNTLQKHYKSVFCFFYTNAVQAGPSRGKGATAIPNHYCNEFVQCCKKGMQLICIDYIYVTKMCPSKAKHSSLNTSASPPSGQLLGKSC